MVPYFCGQDPRCRQRNSWAVTKAKENIEKYYAAVGLTEELPASLALFETLMPRFFNGAIGNARMIRHFSSIIRFRREERGRGENQKRHLHTQQGFINT